MGCCPKCGYKYKKRLKTGKVRSKSLPTGIEWFYAKGHKKIFISKCGKIWSKDLADYKIPFLKDGYLAFKIHKKIKFLHRLLAMTFIKGYKPGLVVNHKDGNKLNNHLNNLEWTTNIRNFCHAVDMGLVDLKYPLSKNRYNKAIRDKLWTPKKIDENGIISCNWPD